MHADQSIPPTAAETASNEPASEHTPLLGDRQTPVETEEPSTKRLLLVLGSTWVGVFLAALGKIARLYLSNKHPTLTSL